MTKGAFVSKIKATLDGHVQSQFVRLGITEDNEVVGRNLL